MQVGSAGFAVDNGGDVTDSVGRVAVVAESGLGAGRVFIESFCIGRSASRSAL